MLVERLCMYCGCKTVDANSKYSEKNQPELELEVGR
jgi:hypothetical protein